MTRTPPFAVSVSLCGIPIATLGSAGGSIVSEAHDAAILMVYLRVPEQPLLKSVALSVKLYVPCFVGVPDSKPFCASVRPGGNAPPATAN